MKFLLTLFLFMCRAYPLVAGQQPNCLIQTFSVNDGLSQRIVTDIAQDDNDFMWFATWSGICRFDGYTFDYFSRRSGDESNLDNTRFERILVGSQGNIWCISYHNRAYLFDTASECFFDVLAPIEKRKGIACRVQTIYTLHSGVVWIICDGGAFRVDEKSLNPETGEGIFACHHDAGSLPGRHILEVSVSENGTEWILTDGGLCTFAEQRLQICSYTPFISYCMFGRELYLITSDARLVRCDTQTNQIENVPLRSAAQTARRIQRLNDDWLGICTENGMLLYEPRTGRTVQPDFGAQKYPPPKNPFMLFCDSRLNIFLFSESDGVYCYNLTSGEMTWLQSDLQDKRHNEYDSIPLCFEDAHGTVWITPVHGEFCYYDPEQKRLCTYYSDPSLPETKFVPLIMNYRIDRQGNMWYSDMMGVGKVSFLSQTITHRQYNPDFETRALMTCRNGELWMADKEGIVRIFRPDHSLRGYLSPNGQIVAGETPFAGRPYCFLEDSQGTIWIGTREDGLFRLQTESAVRFAVRQYEADAGNLQALSNNSIFSLCEDWKGRLWIGTFGGGINLFDPSDEERGFLHGGNAFFNYPQGCERVRKVAAVGHCILIGTTNGLAILDGDFSVPEMCRFYLNRYNAKVPTSLPANNIMYIYTDSRGVTYVISFAGGISRIRSRNLLSDTIEFDNFTRSDGLTSDLLMSIIEDYDQRLWVIAEHSLQRFTPNTRQIEDLTRLYDNSIYFSEGAPVRFGDHVVIATLNGLLEVNSHDLTEIEQFKPKIVFTGIRSPYADKLGDLNQLTELRLKPDFRNLSLSYAALDYVRPSAINYAYRLQGLEDQWHYVDKNRMTGYLSLPVGTYRLEIRSTNSNGFWIDNTRSLTIIVPPTFWESNWAVCFWIVLFLMVTGLSTLVIVYIWKLHHRIDIEEQLTDVKLRFFTNISHELRTPLTLIASPVSEVINSERLSDRARKLLVLVQQNTDRMLSLVNQILDFRKAETRNMKLFVEQIDWVSFTEYLAEPFVPMASERRIEFRFDCNEASIAGWADRDKVEKIVINLLSNAFKYTPNGQSVTLTLSRCDDHVELIVADQGIGISAEFRKKMFRCFESFVKDHPMQPSSGLGLSLVKELVTLHGGSIDVESEVGKGSRFTVSFPLDAEVYTKMPHAEFVLTDIRPDKSALSLTRTTAEPARMQPAEKHALLIVEDNNELRSFLRDMLEDTFLIHEAANGAEALEVAHHETLDMIISDVAMPVMDGLELVRTVKADRELCHLPIILLSAHASLDARIEGLETGVDDYIPKPFSASYLKTRIRTLLRMRSELQQQYLARYAEKATSETREQDDPLNRMPAPKIENLDEQFLTDVMAAMEEQMDNSDLTVEQLASAVHMGRLTFGNKLKSLTGLTTIEFIREIRLRRAKQLLENRQTNSSGAAYMTGFSDPNWFSKCFKKRFGISPSQVVPKVKSE